MEQNVRPIPCPFCGSEIIIGHSDQIKHQENADTCIIGRLVWDKSMLLRWNTRADLPAQTNCDACGKPITDYQKNVGYECDLHEWCVDHSED